LAHSGANKSTTKYGIRISRHPVIISNYSINKFIHSTLAHEISSPLWEQSRHAARAAARAMSYRRGDDTGARRAVPDENQVVEHEIFLSHFKIVLPRSSVSRVIQLNATKTTALKSKNTSRALSSEVLMLLINGNGEFLAPRI
jgi:hypothetical protein